MDADFWGGIAILVVAGGLGAFCVFGAVVGRRLGHTTPGGVVFLVLIGPPSWPGAVTFFPLRVTARPPATSRCGAGPAGAGPAYSPQQDSTRTRRVVKLGSAAPWSRAPTSVSVRR